jgi:hypothetical protein
MSRRSEARALAEALRVLARVRAGQLTSSRYAGGCPVRRGTLVTAVPLSWLHSECCGVLLARGVNGVLAVTE